MQPHCWALPSAGGGKRRVGEVWASKPASDIADGPCRPHTVHLEPPEGGVPHSISALRLLSGLRAGAGCVAGR